MGDGKKDDLVAVTVPYVVSDLHNKHQNHEINAKPAELPQPSFPATET